MSVLILKSTILNMATKTGIHNLTKQHYVLILFDDLIVEGLSLILLQLKQGVFDQANDASSV